MMRSAREYLGTAAFTAAALIIPGAAVAQASASPQQARVSDVQATSPAGADPAGASAPTSQSTQSTPAGQTVPDDTGLSDIVVTASKRSTNLQSTPIAVTALTGAELGQARINDLGRLPLQVPGLVVVPTNNFGTSIVVLRGIGSLFIGPGADEGVGIYVDDIYQGHAYGNVFDLVDIERIEVLRGPQGTLYGRNATGGAINIITKQPGDTLTGQANAELTSFNGVRVNAYLMAPLVANTLSLKVSGGYARRSGWARNLTQGQRVNGYDTSYISGELRWRPDELTDIRLNGKWVRFWNDTNYRVVKDYGTSDPVNIYRANDPGYDRGRSLSASLYASRDLEFASLVSITGYIDGQDHTVSDPDGTADEVAVNDAAFKNRQFSEELRLLSRSGGRFNWILGAQFMSDLTFGPDVFTLPPFNTSYVFDFRVKTHSYSAFAEVTYKLTDQLKLTAGARFIYEKKYWQGCVIISGANASSNLCDGQRVPDDRSFNKITPRVVLDYQPNRDIFLYASATRGLRSGGWSFSEATVPNRQNGFNPEDVWSYEVGAKTEMFDRHLRLNLAAFLADYSKLQVRGVDPTTTLLLTRNAADARIKGVEFEANARPIEGLSLLATVTYLDARYTDFKLVQPGMPTIDYSGNRLTRAPKWSASFVGQYDIKYAGIGIVTPRVEYRHSSRMFFTEQNVAPFDARPQDIVNLRLSLSSPDSRWSFSTFVDNLLKDRTLLNVVASPVGLPVGFYTEPRIYGVRTVYSW